MADLKKQRPGAISVGGEQYNATVVRIFDLDKYGRPKQCMLVHDDDSVDINGGEQFMIVYVPKKMLKKGS